MASAFHFFLRGAAAKGAPISPRTERAPVRSPFRLQQCASSARRQRLDGPAPECQRDFAKVRVDNAGFRHSDARRREAKQIERLFQLVRRRVVDGHQILDLLDALSQRVLSFSLRGQVCSIISASSASVFSRSSPVLPFSRAAHIFISDTDNFLSAHICQKLSDPVIINTSCFKFCKQLFCTIKHGSIRQIKRHDASNRRILPVTVSIHQLVFTVKYTASVRRVGCLPAARPLARLPVSLPDERAAEPRHRRCVSAVRRISWRRLAVSIFCERPASALRSAPKRFIPASRPRSISAFTLGNERTRRLQRADLQVHAIFILSARLTPSIWRAAHFLTQRKKRRGADPQGQSLRRSGALLEHPREKMPCQARILIILSRAAPERSQDETPSAIDEKCCPSRASHIAHYSCCFRLLSAKKRRASPPYALRAAIKYAQACVSSPERTSTPCSSIRYHIPFF